MTRLLAVSCCVLAISGCAGGGGGETDDAGGSRDSRPRPDGQPVQDTGMTPDVSTGCADAEHLCETGCYPDQPNEPVSGCRLGCGRPCDVPEHGEAFCSEAGRCAVRCTPPAVLSGGRCQCTPLECTALGAECGSVDDGCGGAVVCGDCGLGAVCSDGLCGCEPDGAEPNDSFTVAQRLTELGYGDSSSYTDYGLTNVEDVDWFELDIKDDGVLPGYSPVIRLALTQVPLGADFNIDAYFRCDDRSSATMTCLGGSRTTHAAGEGCSSGASGADMMQFDDLNCTGSTDESGTLFVRVTASRWADQCRSYKLDISVPNV